MAISTHTLQEGSYLCDDGARDVGKLRRLVGVRAEIAWDPSLPDGQPRRRLDVSRAAERFGFRARTPLVEGLRRTIAWWEAESARR